MDDTEQRMHNFQAMSSEEKLKYAREFKAALIAEEKQWKAYEKVKKQIEKCARTYEDFDLLLQAARAYTEMAEMSVMAKRAEFEVIKTIAMQKGLDIEEKWFKKILFYTQFILPQYYYRRFIVPRWPRDFWLFDFLLTLLIFYVYFTF